MPESNEHNVDLNRVSMVLCSIEKDGTAECEIHDHLFNYFTLRNIAFIDSDSSMNFQRGGSVPGLSLTPTMNIIGEVRVVDAHRDRHFLMRVEKNLRKDGMYALLIKNSKDSRIFDYRTEKLIPEYQAGGD